MNLRIEHLQVHKSGRYNVSEFTAFSWKVFVFTFSFFDPADFGPFSASDMRVCVCDISPRVCPPFSSDTYIQESGFGLTLDLSDVQLRRVVQDMTYPKTQGNASKFEVNKGSSARFSAHVIFVAYVGYLLRLI